MTHITCTFSSVCMETDASFHVLLPSVRNGLLPLTEPLIPEGGFPTLYLLHGIGDSAQSWLLNSQIGLLCDKYRIAVVLPSCQNSFYADSPDGPKAFSYITSELLDYTRAVFPLSSRREDTFLGGYSMGGYGAVRIGVLCPQLFGKIFSLSGALEVNAGTSFSRICGYSMPSHLKNSKALKNTDADIFYCLEQAAPKEHSFPPFYIACGTEDLFVKCAEKFCSRAKALGLRDVLNLSPGKHDWEYWSKALSQAVSWLFQEENDLY